MKVKEYYETIGADYEDVLNRMMRKESLVIKFIRKFPEDQSFKKLCESLENKEIEEAFRAAHTLKGVAQNLSLTSLYQIASVLTEKLRNQEMDGTEELLEKVREEYEKTIALVGQIEDPAEA